MGKQNSPIYFVLIILALVTISCGLFGRVTGKEEGVESASKELIRHWASFANASSEYGNPDWATSAASMAESGRITR